MSDEDTEQQPEVRQETQTFEFSDDEAQGTYKTFMTTFNLEAEDEKQLADDTINFILRQLNQASLKGVIWFDDYRDITMSSVRGLFKLIYIVHYSPDLMRRDVIFASSKNLLMLLLSRVYEGKHYQFLLKELESKRPITIQSGGR